MDEIPEIQLTMNPKTPEARSAIGFKWNATAGKAHKIGGQPDWIQSEDTPECSQCFKKMTFYGQLDCLGDKVALGDCGRIFVFVCLDVSGLQGATLTRRKGDSSDAGVLT